MIKKLLRVTKVAVENIYFEDNNKGEICIIKVRPHIRETNRCPLCGRISPKYDSPNKLRRWRSLDWGTHRVYIESTAPRVSCKNHGVIVARVPWARHDSDYTRDFEQTIGWCSLHMTATDISEYYRIKWHTVGAIVKRVYDEIEASKPQSRFDNLVKIGIDETSYKKGHKYMTVVVNHETGALIWAKKGHGKEILTNFFEELTKEQRESIKLVSADGAGWIADCVKDFCPNAERCLDPFHVVQWANNALDEVRKNVVRDAKTDVAKGVTVQGGKKNRKSH